MGPDDHGITPPLEQDEPRSDPGPQNRPVEGGGSLRPVSKLQEADPQTHEGHPERPPYETAAPSDTMGLEHVELALSDLTFPVSRKDLLQDAGNWRIPTTGEHFHLLREYLVDVDTDEFRSARDVVRAIAKAHPELKRGRR